MRAAPLRDTDLRAYLRPLIASDGAQRAAEAGAPRGIQERRCGVIYSRIRGAAASGCPMRVEAGHAKCGGNQVDIKTTTVTARKASLEPAPDWDRSPHALRVHR